MPNPADCILNIDIRSINMVATLGLTNLSGKPMRLEKQQSCKRNNSFIIDFENKQWWLVIEPASETGKGSLNLVKNQIPDQ